MIVEINEPGLSLNIDPTGHGMCNGHAVSAHLEEFRLESHVDAIDVTRDVARRYLQGEVTYEIRLTLRLHPRPQPMIPAFPERPTLPEPIGTLRTITPEALE